MTITEKLEAIGDAIRNKTGGVGKLTLADMPEQIEGISGNKLNYEKTFYTAGITRRVFKSFANDDAAAQVLDSFDFSGDNVELRYLMGYQANITTFDFSVLDGCRPATTISMFNGCTKLETLRNVGRLNVDLLTDLKYMFQNCSSLEEIDLSSWNMPISTKSVAFQGMFEGCTSLKTLKTSTFLNGAPSSVTNQATFPVAMSDENGNTFKAGAYIPVGAHTYTAV